MKLAKAAGVFAANIAWRAMGLRPAGRALVRALGSVDENVRTIAGEKSEPLLLEALDRRENVPLVLTVLGSIGDRKLEPRISGFVQDPDPEVAKAARDALRMIEAHKSPA
jgi:hypothetical protein